MTTAKLESRTYIPYDVVAIKYCNLHFYGDDAEELDDQWTKVEFSKYDKINPKVEALERKIKRFKPRKVEHQILWFKWHMDDYSELEQMKSKLERLKDDMFFDASELVVEADYFLRERGFAITQESSVHSLTTVTTSIYQRSA